MKKLTIIDIKYSLKNSIVERLVNLITLGFYNFLSSLYKPKFKDYLSDSSFEREIEKSKIECKEISLYLLGIQRIMCINGNHYFPLRKFNILKVILNMFWSSITMKHIGDFNIILP